MADSYFIFCEKGHFTQKLLLDDFSPLQYLIDDSYCLHPMKALAWCSSCYRFVEAESLPSLDDIEDALLHTDDYSTLNERFDGRNWKLISWLSNAVWRKSVHEALDYRESLKIKFDWRSSRQSAPRCLDCGSTDLTYGTSMPNGDQYFVHPACGGQCEVDASHNNTLVHYRDLALYMTGEGLRMRTFLERVCLDEDPLPDDKLIALVTRLQGAKTIGGFSTSRRIIADYGIRFRFITSLPSEYDVDIWSPDHPDAQQYYEQVARQHQKIELLRVGNAAFFAPDGTEKEVALMRYQDMIASISRRNAGHSYRTLRSTTLTKEQFLNIFADIYSLLVEIESD